MIVISKIAPYLTKINDCKKQLADQKLKAGIVQSPVTSAEETEINTAGCTYNFKKDAKAPDIINFDLMVFDSIGIPYIYNMKMEKLLAVCRRNASKTRCQSQEVDKYRDLTDGKAVIIGIINDLIPGKEKDSQPDLNYLVRLKRALERKSFYPLQLSNGRIQIWSLSY